jgi:hypothetical protein
MDSWQCLTLEKCLDLAINPLKKKRNLFYLKNQFVPRSKHSLRLLTIDQLIRCRITLAVYPVIQTKHLNALRGQNVEFFNVKPGGTFSNR